MPTAASWTEAPGRGRRRRHLRRLRARWRSGRRRRATAGPLRSARHHRARRRGPGVLRAGDRADRRRDVLNAAPGALAGFLALAVVSAVASGGGRELLSASRRSPSRSARPPTTSAPCCWLPLNIAWLLQAWVLLGATAYADGPGAGGSPPRWSILLWILVATAPAQVVAWAVEAVRRGPAGWCDHPRGRGRHGGVGGRLYSAAASASLDALPTRVARAGVDGQARGHVAGLLALVVAGPGGPRRRDRALPRAAGTPATSLRSRARATPPGPALGHRPGRAAAHRPGVDVAVGPDAPRHRGLAVGPGLVGLAGGLDWTRLTILPGLVASGGALLFGVNAWCLDGRGALWRESLPVEPGPSSTPGRSC